MLREQPTLTIRELASVLDVSEMTIRRDLTKLKDSGLLVRALGMNMIGNAQQKGISPAKYDFHNEITPEQRGQTKNSNESSRINQCSRCDYFGFKYNC